MSGSNHDSDYQAEEQHASSPSAFLDLGQGEESMENKSVASRSKQISQQLNELNKHGRANTNSANLQERKEKYKEPSVKNNKKKIKKHETSHSDSQASYHEFRSKKESRKRGDNKGKGKRGRKSKLDTDELKKELSELMDCGYPSQHKATQKIQSSKRNVAEPNRAETTSNQTIWKNVEQGESDCSSVKAEINEQTINSRIQSHLYKKIAELVNQNADNIVDKISDIPFLTFTG